MQGCLTPPPVHDSNKKKKRKVDPGAKDPSRTAKLQELAKQLRERDVAVLRTHPRSGIVPEFGQVVDTTSLFDCLNPPLTDSVMVECKGHFCTA